VKSVDNIKKKQHLLDNIKTTEVTATKNNYLAVVCGCWQECARNLKRASL